ncbi:MAG: substrate-binding domain-containing protein [Terracidiphilus sp.]
MTIPKYTDVFRALQHEILKGKYAGGRRLPSEAELCQRYKISRPTAARALRELQQIGVITRRAGSGSYLVPPQITQPSAAHTLGLLMPGLGNTEILDPICNEITRFAQSLGYSVLWGDATRLVSNGEDAFQLCKQFVERPVAGVFFAPMESVPDREKWNQRIAEECRSSGIPMVLLDRDLGEFSSRSEHDLVAIDNVAAAIELTQHILSSGRQRICFLARPNFPSTTDLRMLGCLEAIRRSGILSKYASAHFGDPSDVNFVQKVVDCSNPDAVICSNDQTAALLIRSLAQIKKNVPEQIAVAGFDDVQYAMLLSPPLTTIRQPCREIARSAVRAMLERIADPSLPPRQILHAHELVIRQSTGE